MTELEKVKLKLDCINLAAKLYSSKSKEVIEEAAERLYQYATNMDDIEKEMD